MKRTITVLLIALMLVCCTNITAFAVTTPNPGDTLSINADAVQITQAGTYTITGTGATTNTITVDPNIEDEVNITLSEVNIDVSSIANTCAMTIGTGTTVNLTITGTNILKSGLNRAGLNVPTGAALNIDGTGSLEAFGRGDLSNGGAGIGGNAGSSAGAISINGGTVTATGGTLGAGIGGGNRGTGGNITINGGTITATSGLDGAGIGGGDSGSAGQITITGGSVTALSTRDGAGIGGGWNANGGVVTISGGIVSATSNEDGAGIGSGNGNSHACTGGTVIIEGSADVTARGGRRGAGIGGGNNGNGGNITISGGTVTATGGHNGAGIGGGYGRYGGNITISGGTVTATGGEDGAGIGGGIGGEGGNIKISGGIVIANAGSQGAGIGGGLLRIGGSIDISGGEIYATGGSASPTSSVNRPGHNIGDGGGASSTEHTRLRLSGTTAVFMRNGASVAVTHRDFKLEIMSVSSLIATYGYNHFPASWGNQHVDGYIYSAVYYYVDFEPQNGSIIDSQAVDQGHKATIPNALLKDGFVFAGWYSDAACDEADHWDFDTDIIEKPTTLYAKWIPAYTVTFDSLGGSAISSQSIGEGFKATKPADPVISDYIFGGWYTSSDCNDDELWDFDADTVSSDITLYAKWTEIPTYTVTFDSGSGSAVDSQTVTEGEKAAKPSDPTRSGYTFGGWYTSNTFNDDDRWNFTSCTVVGDMTLYAKWTAIPVTPTYTVTFDAQDGSGISSQNVDEGEKASKPSAPTRTNYTFNGWYTRSNCNEDYKWNFEYCSVDNNITLYAKWTAITKAPIYTVQFDAQGGSVVSSQMVDEGKSASKPSKPTRSGYTLCGWYTSTNCAEDDRWNFAYCTVSKDIALYAKWTAVSQETAYTVTFDAQGGSVVSSNTTDEGKTASKPSDPARSGYTFCGWYTSTNCSDDDRWNFEYCTVSKDITLYAKWISVLEEAAYTVTFDAQGGSVVSSQATDEGKSVFRPSDPTRSGYTFGGWYTSSTCHYNDRWNFEYCTVSKDITLYAKWTTVSKEAEPTETPIQTDTTSSEETSPKPSISPKAVITPTVIKENKENGTTTIEIDINTLPEGTEKIKLPSGETILINGKSDTVQIQISSENLNESGAIDIVALNNEGTPLSSHYVQIKDDNGQTIAFNADKGWAAMSSVLIWILICAVGLGVSVFITYLILKKKRV